MLELSIFNPNTQCKTQPPICLRAFKACDYSTERLRSADVRMPCSIRRHLHFGSPKNQVGIKKKWSKRGMGGFCLNLSGCTFIRHLKLASLWNAYDKKQKKKKKRKKERKVQGQATHGSEEGKSPACQTATVHILRVWRWNLQIISSLNCSVNFSRRADDSRAVDVLNYYTGAFM